MTVSSQTIAVWFVAWLLPSLGFGWKGTLIVVSIVFPLSIFSALYGFYKGIVQHYGFDGKRDLFFGGRF